MNALDRLAGLGSSLAPFWTSTLLWTVFAALVLGVLLLVPKRLTSTHHDVRAALLLSLPLSIMVGAVFTLRAPDWIPTVILPEVVIGLGGPSTPSVDVFTSPVSLFLGVLTLISVLFTTVGIFRLLVDVLGLRRILAEATDIAAPNEKALFSEVVDQLALPAGIRLMESSGTSVPFVTGLSSPIVVLPQHCSRDEDSLRLIFLHECGHLVRNDHWTGPLSRLIGAIFAVHPLVARLNGSMTFYREAACDGFVLSRTGGARRSYANLLFSMAQGRIMEPVPALSIHSHPSQLKQRIQAMSYSESNILKTTGRLVALLVLVAATTLSACTDPAATVGQDDTSAPQPRLAEPGNEVFTVVEQMPVLIGGINSVAEAVKYPSVAKKAGIEGRVLIQFIVDEEGHVRDAAVAKGVHEALDAEALRAVNTLAFEPGVQRGNNVKVKMTLPITFRLQ